MGDYTRKYHQQPTNEDSANYSNNDQQEDSEPKGLPQACLYVASLSNETTEQSLTDFFSEFGKVLKVTLLKDRTRPYAFVQFLTVEDSERALEESKGQVLDDRRLRVEKAKVNRTLFLAKFSKHWQQNQLREVVEEFGTVESVTIIKNHQTNKSKGCGFVKFLYREDAMEAFMNLQSKQRKWVVEWATSNNDPDYGVDKYNIFVGGLHPTQVDEEILKERFGNYGEIESITLINRNEHSSNGDIDPSDYYQAPQKQNYNGDKNNGEGDKSREEYFQSSTESDSNNNSKEHGPSPPSDDSEGNYDENTTSNQRNAFAFIRYKDQAHSALAIEFENGAKWCDRKIRVQYCESQEMKNKRRAQKYMKMYGQYNSYFRGMPMMIMGGVPMPYYPPYIDTNNVHHKYNPFIQNPVDTDLYQYSYPPMYYNNMPWLGYPQMPMDHSNGVMYPGMEARGSDDHYDSHQMYKNNYRGQNYTQWGN